MTHAEEAMLINNTKVITAKKRTFVYVMVLLAVVILGVGAVYTWFSLSTNPNVTDMHMFIATEGGIELAKEYDASDEEWGQQIEFNDLIKDTAPLKPVTWSDANSIFETIEYGFDGRMTDKFTPLNDMMSANRNDMYGYYVVGTFYARSGRDVKVSLAEAVELNDGENGAGTYVIGSPVWNAETISNDNAGSGAESAVRLGFMISYLDELGVENTSKGKKFYVYEPNCDMHVDEMGNAKIDSYQPTKSFDGLDTLVPEERLILQTASTWTEANPVQRDVTIKDLGTFLTSTDLFDLAVEDIVKIQLYVWLEGMDVDCTNRIKDANIMANIQFHCEYDGGSGMVVIPTD